MVERFAEGPDGPALLPVTLRNVEAGPQVQGLQAGAAPAPHRLYRQGEHAQISTDADIIAWFRKVARYDNYHVQRRVAARDVKGPLPKVIDDERDHVQTRMLSLLAGQGGVKTLDLPQVTGKELRPFEVVGIPLPPGFHVVEIASQKLGLRCWMDAHGEGRTMYVRTSALVTNLGVHFKLGRENAAVWVTSLDKGKPVAGAKVRVSDCRGRELAQAITNEQGVAMIEGLSPMRRLATATTTTARVRRPISSAPVMRRAGWKTWPSPGVTGSGREPWRFNVPTSSEVQPDARAHGVRPHPAARGRDGVDEALLPPGKPQGFDAPPRARAPCSSPMWAAASSLNSRCSGAKPHGRAECREQLCHSARCQAG